MTQSNIVKGEIKIGNEFGQACKRCNKMFQPQFDQEATDKAMSKVVERIKKVFYNVGTPASERSARHSKAMDHKAPHDSKRCQACREGKCIENQDSEYEFGRYTNANSKFESDRNYKFQYGTKCKIAWRLNVDGKIIRKVSGHQK